MGGGALIVAAICLLFALPILYMLSVGLLIWLQAQGYISLETAESLAFIYVPLQWGVVRSESFREFVEWYQSLFVN